MFVIVIVIPLSNLMLTKQLLAHLSIVVGCQDACFLMTLHLIIQIIPQNNLLLPPKRFSFIVGTSSSGHMNTNIFFNMCYHTTN